MRVFVSKNWGILRSCNDRSNIAALLSALLQDGLKGGERRTGLRPVKNQCMADATSLFPNLGSDMNNMMVKSLYDASETFTSIQPNQYITRDFSIASENYLRPLVFLTVMCTVSNIAFDTINFGANSLVFGITGFTTSSWNIPTSDVKSFPGPYKSHVFIYNVE